MNQEPKQGEDMYPIQCVWCGAKIRDDKQEDASGVCLKCFYEIMSNHLQSQQRTVYGDFVSDR